MPKPTRARSAAAERDRVGQRNIPTVSRMWHYCQVKVGKLMQSGIKFTRQGRRSEHNGHQAYKAIGDVSDLSKWFTSHGFRVVHTYTMYLDRPVEVPEESEENSCPPAVHAHYP